MRAKTNTREVESLTRKEVLEEIKFLNEYVEKLEKSNQRLWKQLKSVGGLMNTICDGLRRAFVLCEFTSAEEMLLMEFLRDIREVIGAMPDYRDAVARLHHTLEKHKDNR